MICIEFCIWKNIFFEGVLFLESRSPKTPTFCRFDPSQEFQKKLTYNRSSAMRLQSQHVSPRLTPIPAVPNQKKQKNAVFALLGTVFNQMVGAPRISTWELVKPVNPPVTLQNWNIGQAFLIAYGLRYSRVSAGLSSLSRKNRSIFRVQIWELRGKIMPSKTR